MKPQRIAILGITGAGKSTLSRRIAEKTGLPLFHMDSLFWRGKWEEVPQAEYLKAHDEILEKNDRWVIDGWIEPAMSRRLDEAELIIYLDYPGWLCAMRYLERSWKHRKVARPELPEESVDRFKFRRFFLLLFRGERPGTERSLEHVDMKKVVRLMSPAETEAYFQKTFA